MARSVCHPIGACRYRRYVVLRGADGALTFLHMPSHSAARFVCAAIHTVIADARRAGE